MPESAWARLGQEARILSTIITRCRMWTLWNKSTLGKGLLPLLCDY